MVSDPQNPYGAGGPQLRVPSPEQLLALFIPDSPKAGARRVGLCRQRLQDLAQGMRPWLVGETEVNDTLKLSRGAMGCPAGGQEGHWEPHLRR